MKKIGILVKPINGSVNIGIGKYYYDFLSKFGEVVFINPLSDTVQKLDLLVLPGGPDVDTQRYGEVPSVFCGRPDIYFEHFDKNMLPKYIENNTPIFGICRGMQSLSVHFGAKMVQDYPFEVSEPRHELLESLVFEKNNFEDDFLELANLENVNINSIHHQCVRDDVPKEILVLARSNVYNTIEAVKIKNKPIVGVQWHPEHVEDTFSVNIIKKLLK